MKINDVERITGLTQKAIRLYESKGLISVSRGENGYRIYSSDNVEALKHIKLLRSVGISVSDIKLYFCGVMSIEELIDKRKAEILNESGKSSENYLICEKILNKEPLESLESDDTFVEKDETKPDSHGFLSVGIDIGTTTVSAVVYDIDNAEQLEAYSIPHASYACSDIRSEQSTSIILEKAERLLYHILDSYDKIKSIGLTGQMHGIVYINDEGEPLSNLINWQDKRADQALEGGESVCQAIERITGEKIATGYGIATHYYNMLTQGVPSEAIGFCSIMDLFGMKICQIKKATTHTSVASSFGLFDVKNGAFMKEKLSLLGIDESFLPRVTEESISLGKCRGIPVYVAIGDNQASFLGSVGEDEQGALVNIGTGSQVSAISDYFKASGELEVRPFVNGKYLACGSALCGGYAYSMLESFFRAYMVSAGAQERPQYDVINKLALDAYKNGKEGLCVDTSFFGKRNNPDIRGSISRIDRQNLTPDELALGVLKGMCNELYELYDGFHEKKARIVASGGAIRKNELLKKLIEDKFGVPVLVSEVKEEAAMGAAIFCMLSSMEK